MLHELLVPVGNYESLVAAINNGADAVYLGGKRFGARAYANNFTLEEVEAATKLCHLYGVKIYVTVNTLIYEREIKEALDYCKKLHKIGVDALIMQDVGLIDLVHQTLPNMEIHASTQMHNHSEESLKFLEDLGIKRVVFARELSLDYINNIDTKLEKEVFIHGSLCVSYSGQCLFSSCILNRSGNRGECAGMCRLPYKLYENNKLIEADGEYILSPKDISSLNNFKELMDSNIKCFKIEGRMKSPAYVGIVTKIYRTLMDQYYSGQELKILDEDLFLLKAIFNREYTKSFLHKDNNIMNFTAPNHLGVHIGEVTDVTKNRIKIKLNHDLKQLEGIRFKNNNLGMIVNFMYNDKDELINKGKYGDTIFLDKNIGLNSLDTVLLTNPITNEMKVVTKKIPISMKFEGELNNEMKISAFDGEKIVIIKGDIIQVAKNSPITEERIKESLLKTGNTPFIINDLNIYIDDNIFIPIGLLNDLRRKVLDKLKTLRENKRVKYIEKEYSNEIIEQVEINIKYEGYIKKALDDAKKMVDLDNKKIPENIDYDKIHNLASEAKQKLSEIRPTSIGQAIRISGVNPADISILNIYLKKEYHNE